MKTQQTLQFVTIEELWAFKSKVNLINFEISAVAKVLTFEGDEEQVDLALNNYNGTIIEIKNENKTA